MQDRRKELRFPISLKVGAREKNRSSIFGSTTDFSRSGLRVVFDEFESEPNSFIDLKIQRPDKDIFVPASAEVIWKRPILGKWEVGFRIKDFVPEAKAEILEYSYNRWLRDKSLVGAYA